MTSTTWATYPILTFEDAPVIETVLIDRPEIPATGAGEPACCPVAAAISNAVFDAIGVRIRDLPMRPDRVKAALQQALQQAQAEKTQAGQRAFSLLRGRWEALSVCGQGQLTLPTHQ